MSAGPIDAIRASPGRRFAVMLMILVAGVGLSACGDNTQQIVDEQYQRTRATMDLVGRYIAEGRLPNARLIQRYAQYVGEARPDVAALTKELATEGTTQGLGYRSLLDRLAKVKKKPADDKEADTVVDELQRIEAAANPTIYNDSLVDVVNVLADMSDGKLARLNVPKTAEKPADGPGSRLVGNPRYGSWRSDSTGNNFWAWYGQYALFSTLFMRPGPYYYNQWYPRRSWSYYGDVGRHYYGTRGDSRRWNQASKSYPNAKPQKTYGQLNSQRNLSTYGRTASRTAGSSLKRASVYSSSSRGSSLSSGSRGK